MDEKDRLALTKEFNQQGKPYGTRLYWRNKHRHWRAWENDDVAMGISGPYRMHFKTVAAIKEYIETNK